MWGQRRCGGLRHLWSCESGIHAKPRWGGLRPSDMRCHWRRWLLDRELRPCVSQPDIQLRCGRGHLQLVELGGQGRHLQSAECSLEPCDCQAHKIWCVYHESSESQQPDLRLLGGQGHLQLIELGGQGRHLPSTSYFPKFAATKMHSLVCLARVITRLAIAQC